MKPKQKPAPVEGIDFETANLFPCEGPHKKIRFALFSAVNQTFRTLDKIIEMIDTCHLELPHQEYNGNALRETAKNLKESLNEAVSHYNFDRIKYAQQIKLLE